MATVNKDFKIKNGLIVEGANGTINGYDILTKDSADQNYIIGLVGGSANTEAVANSIVLRDSNASFSANVITADLVGDVTGTVSDISNHDTGDLSEGTNLYFTNTRADARVVSMLTNATQTNISITEIGGALVIEAENGVADSTTDDLDEGITNLYFSNTRARDAVSAGEGLQYNSSTGEFTAHLGYGLEIANNAIRIDDSIVATDSDVSAAISAHDALSGVHGVTGNVVGTTDAQTLSNKTLGSNLDANNNTITNLKAPGQSTDAATKGYVDAISEGLHIHASAVAATTANINLATDLENGDILDGVTLATGNRVLVKNQSTASQNGIYVVQASGAAVRAADFDAPAEVDGGDFVFVSGGDTQADTGWVQTSELVATIGVDPIYFTQFSGAGTFLAGYGLYLDGNEFNVDSNVIASLSYVANAVSDHSALLHDVHGIDGLTDGDVVGTAKMQTLSNKTLGDGIVLGNNIDAVNTFTIVNLEEPTNNQDAATKFYVDDAITGVGNTISGLDTDDVSEGANNLYFTNARAEAAVSNLDTDDLDEGSTNLYFTNARAEAAMVTPITGGTQTNISVTYDGLTGTYTFAAENGVADSTTSDLTEGTNLYFTNARAVAALQAVVPNFTEVDINAVATQVAATTGNIASASQVTAFSWPKASYRSAEFLVKTAYSTHTEVSKVILTMDTSDNIAITEYAIVGTNGSASTITADVSGSDARLRVTTLNNNSTVTVMGTLLV
jgi:hypothetical protein